MADSINGMIVKIVGDEATVVITTTERTTDGIRLIGSDTKWFTACCFEGCAEVYQNLARTLTALGVKTVYTESCCWIDGQKNHPDMGKLSWKHLYETKPERFGMIRWIKVRGNATGEVL